MLDVYLAEDGQLPAGSGLRFIDMLSQKRSPFCTLKMSVSDMTISFRIFQEIFLMVFFGGPEALQG